MVEIKLAGAGGPSSRWLGGAKPRSNYEEWDGLAIDRAVFDMIRAMFQLNTTRHRYSVPALKTLRTVVEARNQKRDPVHPIFVVDFLPNL